jgi:hypothetical protein
MRGLAIALVPFGLGSTSSAAWAQRIAKCAAKHCRPA